MAEAATYEEAVWSWHRHLAAGGSTPWREWLTDGAAAPGEPVPAGWTPPGAAQLELLRRVAARGGLSGEATVRLADLVTSRSGPGRGLGQLPLLRPDRGPRGTAPEPGRARTGAPPVDPAEVPAEELVRVGTGALTELLLQTPAPAEPSPVRRQPVRGRWTSGRRRRPSFVLAGAPVTTALVRRTLEAAGHREGGRSPQVFVLVEPFDRALAQVWSARVQHGAPVRWHGFVQRWSGRRELPPSLDLTAVAGGWAARVGPGRVHLVAADPSGSGVAAAGVVAEVLGPDPRPPAPPSATPTGVLDLSPAAVDVARRVNAVLGVRVPPDRHRVVLRRLVELLERCDLPRPPGSEHLLTVPEPARRWAQDRAEQQVGALSAGGYPVHGSVDRFLPRFGDLATHPRREDALEVVTACLTQVLPSGRHPQSKEQ